MLTTVLLFSKLYLREGERAAEQGSTEQSRQKTDSPEYRKEVVLELLHQTMRGHGAGDCEQRRCNGNVRIRKNRSGDTPDAHRPAQKIIERRKSVEGKDSQRQHTQIISCPYSRPCGDTAHLADTEISDNRSVGSA